MNHFWSLEIKRFQTEWESNMQKDPWVAWEQTLESFLWPILTVRFPPIHHLNPFTVWQTGLIGINRDRCHFWTLNKLVFLIEKASNDKDKDNWFGSGMHQETINYFCQRLIFFSAQCKYFLFKQRTFETRKRIYACQMQDIVLFLLRWSSLK
jgi:hypothetical protein